MRRRGTHLIGRCHVRFNDWRAPARIRVGVVGGLVTLACSLALLPVVSRGFWMDRAIVLVAAIVAAGAIMRAIRVPLPLLPLGSCGVLLGGLCALFAPESAVLNVIPTPAAIAQLRTLLEAGRADAWASVPPAEQTPGLLLIVVAAVGLIALVVDTLAAGLDLPTLTLLPLGGLYAAPWLVGAGYPPAASLILLTISWLTLLSAHERDRIRALIPAAAPSPAYPTVVAALCCLSLALGVAAWLPGAGAGKRAGPQGPLALSVEPIVSLRQSVIAATGRTVLTYRTTAKRPEYLRLAALELFDGNQWTVGPPAPAAPPAPNGAGPLVKYELSIGPLAGPVIPSPAGTISAWTDTDVGLDAAGLPNRITGWVTDTEALLQVRGLGWTARYLNQASTQYAPPPAGTATDPTSVVGSAVATLAREVTRGAANDFEQALALQQWFTTTGGFRYSTAISDDDADMMSFLSQREGYCEQFAATMAVMARTLGIPARVMVGFTPGRMRAGIWTVTDAEAHAWPELWMGTAGWVRFEPTPRSDAISVPSYALDPGAANRPSEAPEPRPTAVESVDETVEEPGQGATASGPSTPDGLMTVAGLAGLLALLSATPALIRWLRRRRRRFNGPNGARDAYREVVDTMIDLGFDDLGVTERATLTRICQRLSADARVSGDRIATALERVRYGKPEIEHDTEVPDLLAPQHPSTDKGSIRSARASSAAGGASTDLTLVAVASTATTRCEQGLANDVAILCTALRDSASVRSRVAARLMPKSLWR